MAWSGLAMVVAGVALAAWVGDRVAPFFLDLDEPPEVLAHDARQILDELGPPTAEADSAYGFALEGNPSAPRVRFWYRQSPRSLADGRWTGAPLLSFTNPRPLVAGMRGVRLDAHGALVEYVRVPMPDETPPADPQDWAAVFRRAGADLEAARPSTPADLPPVFGDERLAWDVSEGTGGTRVEAASFHGRPVWFRVQEPGGASSDPEVPRGSLVWLSLVLGILVLATVLAHRQVRIGRADHDGARRVALFVAFSGVGFFALSDPRFLMWPLVLFVLMMFPLFLALASWVLYLALEPIVRRRWPDTLVSWTRLLRGRALDPLVGREVLLGVLGGIVVALLAQVARFAEGAPHTRWPGGWISTLANGWSAVGWLVDRPREALTEGLLILLVLVLFHRLLRRTWAALGLTLALFAVPIGLANPAMLPSFLLVRGVLWGLLIRPGLLGGVVAMSVRHFLGASLITTHLGAWYANQAIAGILATLVLAAWGFYASLGGQSVFGDPRREAA